MRQSLLSSLLLLLLSKQSKARNTFFPTPLASGDLSLGKRTSSLRWSPTTAPASVVYVRGGGTGDEESLGVPQVSGVPPGGSTTTRTLSSKEHQQQQVPFSSSAAHTATTFRSGAVRLQATPIAVSTPSVNSTRTTSSVEIPHKLTRKEKREQKRELKRHKQLAKKLKNRNATNLRRKVMHASFGFFFAALNHFIPKAKFVPGMAALTGATLVMELLRYRKGFGWMNDILHFFLGSSLRKHEMDGKFTGSFYYFLGVTLTSWLYPTSAATLGICQLAIADPTASYFGRATRHVYWSRIENGFGGLGRNKGILGFLGGAVACAPMNYRLLSLAKFGVSPTSQQLWTASLLLGLAGAFADLAVPTPTWTLPKRVMGVRVPPFHVDDNVVVPVFSAWACTKIFAYLQFPADLALSKFVVV